MFLAEEIRRKAGGSGSIPFFRRHTASASCEACGTPAQGTPVRIHNKGRIPAPVDGWERLCHACQLKAKMTKGETVGMLAKRLEREAKWHDKAPSMDTSGIDSVAVARMDDDAAFAELVRRRWPTGATCPRCGGSAPYAIKSRRVFRCRGCAHQFTPTSGTVWHAHKVGPRELLLLMAGDAANVVNKRAAVDAERRRVLSEGFSGRCHHGQVADACVDCRHDMVVADYEAGMSGAKVAERHGLKPTAVYEALRNRGVVMRRRGPA